MNLAEIQAAIDRETEVLQKKIDKRQCILDTYVGDPTRLKLELEKWKSELAIWEKCRSWISQVN
ncbi:hypothetical protein PN462_20135 [Spirulina sp. CS-785/01]|uniref:hypothetical protein n=1 Tax=Spirulina sp. CS-785/01 TaxID=3021716 RepID=UPI00232B3441|nr:hypothetical protein [Spirulina sp. CS-785/01]MDB9315435.1 hypothetical protein [Spirulina sp. CS-785/01]